MSNHLPDPASRQPVSLGEESLAERLDELGRELAVAEIESGAATARATEGAFMQAVERRAQFRSWSRVAPRLGVAAAAAAAVAITAGYLVVASRTSTTHLPDPPIASGSTEPMAPTLANLRKLNQDVSSPDQLKLTTGAGAKPDGSSAAADPGRAATPIDARASDRIDAITGGK
ncbi:MAG: hypothetical protein IT438_07175 [Phycisphaerales bacterium]|nr:hypothetical protein [Phycisphaerales bacterium]